jgi:hypothetical protein
MTKKYTEIPEFVTAEKAYQEVVKAVDSFKTIRAKATDSIASILLDLRGQMDKANAEKEKASAQIAAEQIHGKGNTKAAVERLKASRDEVERIKETPDAVTQTSGLAIIELEKRRKAIEREIYETESYRRGATLHTWSMNESENLRIIKEKTKQYDLILQEKSAELDRIDAVIKTLGEAAKGDINADAGTVEAAKAVMDAAAKAWNIRHESVNKLIVQPEENNQRIEELREYGGALYDAISAASPDLLRHLLVSGEVAAVLWSDIWTAGNESERIAIKIREAAKALEK